MSSNWTLLFSLTSLTSLRLLSDTQTSHAIKILTGVLEWQEFPWSIVSQKLQSRHHHQGINGDRFQIVSPTQTLTRPTFALSKIIASLTNTIPTTLSQREASQMTSMSSRVFHATNCLVCPKGNSNFVNSTRITWRSWEEEQRNPFPSVNINSRQVGGTVQPLMTIVSLGPSWRVVSCVCVAVFLNGCNVLFLKERMFLFLAFFPKSVKWS